MNRFATLDPSRSRTISTTASLHAPATPSPGAPNPNRPNPFETPAASIYGAVSTFPASDAAGGKYFRSRRIRKDGNYQPTTFKKDPKEKFLWIIPVMGIVLGLSVTAIMIYLKIGRLTPHQYCPILDDDFSSGVLNPSIWTKEQEVGGYGNGQFEQTTADEENVFIKEGKLYLKPTLQDESLITANSVINLTASGICTSEAWTNCVASTNITNGTMVPPTKSARLNTKLGASIRYGRVEVTAKIPQGDWLWPAIWMMPITDNYGIWPASGEIDIMESRGNNHTYSLGGNDKVSSALHWGPDPLHDAYKQTTDFKNSLHTEYGDAFHTYGLEWSEKYIFTYVDTRLRQVFYHTFRRPFWDRGGFPLATINGTRLIDPWSQTGRPQTPFDQEFYLIINVAVGGTNGWFQDGSNGKPWVDASPTAPNDFWKARHQWFPTWAKNGEMIVDRVQMWKQC